MERTKIAQRVTASVAASFVGLLLLAGPVSADAYSDAEDNNTGQERDPGTTDPGATDPGVTTPGTIDDTPVGQVDDDLAFTGSDARSLALIGATIAGAGGVLVVTSRRRNAELV